MYIVRGLEAYLIQNLIKIDQIDTLYTQIGFIEPAAQAAVSHCFSFACAAAR